MSFLKLLLGIVFMAVILFFAVLNMEETVDLRLWANLRYTYRDVPLVFAMLCAYFFGIVTYLVVSLTRDLRFRTEIARLRRENRILTDEVHHLRGSVLDDLPLVEAKDLALQEGRSR